MATITAPRRLAASDCPSAAVGRCGGVADDGHTITTRPPTEGHPHGHHHTRPCAASDCLRWVDAVGHCTRSPSHTAMRCFRLPAVGRCGGSLHTATITTRPPSQHHADELLPTARLLRWVAAVVSLMTATPSHARPPSHTAMRCFRLPASSEGHHTRPPSPHHTPTEGHLDGALRRGT